MPTDLQWKLLSFWSTRVASPASEFKLARRDSPPTAGGILGEYQIFDPFAGKSPVGGIEGALELRWRNQWGAALRSGVQGTSCPVAGARTQPMATLVGLAYLGSSRSNGILRPHLRPRQFDTRLFLNARPKQTLLQLGCTPTLNPSSGCGPQKRKTPSQKQQTGPSNWTSTHRHCLLRTNMLQNATRPCLASASASPPPEQRRQPRPSFGSFVFFLFQFAQF